MLGVPGSMVSGQGMKTPSLSFPTFSEDSCENMRASPSAVWWDSQWEGLSSRGTCLRLYHNLPRLSWRTAPPPPVQ